LKGTPKKLWVFKSNNFFECLPLSTDTFRDQNPPKRLCRNRFFKLINFFNSHLARSRFLMFGPVVSGKYYHRPVLFYWKCLLTRLPHIKCIRLGSVRSSLPKVMRVGSIATPFFIWSWLFARRRKYMETWTHVIHLNGHWLERTETWIHFTWDRWANSRFVFIFVSFLSPKPTARSSHLRKRFRT